MSATQKERSILQIRITYFRSFTKTTCVFVSQRRKPNKSMVVGNMKYLCHEQCVSGRAPRLSLVEEDLSNPPEHPNATRFYVGIVWLESSFF